MTMKYFPAGISKKLTSPPRESAFRPIFKRGLTKLTVNSNFTSNWFCFAIAGHSNLFTGRNRPAKFSSNPCTISSLNSYDPHLPYPHFPLLSTGSSGTCFPALWNSSTVTGFPRHGTTPKFFFFYSAYLRFCFY